MLCVSFRTAGDGVLSRRRRKSPLHYGAVFRQAKNSAGFVKGEENLRHYRKNPLTIGGLWGISIIAYI